MTFVLICNEFWGLVPSGVVIPLMQWAGRTNCMFVMCQIHEVIFFPIVCCFSLIWSTITCTIYCFDCGIWALTEVCIRVLKRDGLKCIYGLRFNDPIQYIWLYTLTSQQTSKLGDVICICGVPVSSHVVELLNLLFCFWFSCCVWYRLRLLASPKVGVTDNR